jgi:hypothetical protein
MVVERHPGSLTGLSDDRLGTAAVSIVVGELEWLPDVAPAVMDRVSRDAVTYPDHFDRRPIAPPLAPGAPPVERSARRTLGRLVVFAVILVVIAGLVFFAATVSSAAEQAALLPIDEIDGTLDVRRIVHIVTETA